MNKKFYRKIVSGFTLVELMVTISIFLVITSVVIFNYSDFKSNVSLQNNTDAVALSIRKAQSYAVGAKGRGGDFSNSYGVHFSTNSSGTGLSGSDKSFLIFSIPPTQDGYDKDKTGACGDSSNECIELFNITSSDKIKDISVLGGSGNGNNKESVDIVFTRPDLRAKFCYRNSNGDSNSCSTNITAVGIVVSNGQAGAKEKTKTITVQNTGQISIQ